MTALITLLVLLVMAATVFFWSIDRRRKTLEWWRSLRLAKMLYRFRYHRTNPAQVTKEGRPVYDNDGNPVIVHVPIENGPKGYEAWFLRRRSKIKAAAAIAVGVLVLMSVIALASSGCQLYTHC